MNAYEIHAGVVAGLAEEEVSLLTQIACKMLTKSLLPLPTGTITRRVTGIDRVTGFKELLASTKTRTPYFYDDAVLSAAKRFTETEMDCYIIPIGNRMTAREAQGFLLPYGMELDLSLQFKLNEDDPAFADNHPNFFQAELTQGGFGCVTWVLGSAERFLSVRRVVGVWVDGWWLPARKIAL